MAKFQLTISADYVSSWGVYEGIREVIQNALDGDQDGFTMEIVPPTDTNHALIVKSHGAQLDRAVWLMGTTSKGDGNHRGCYGEGLKLGALALARAGRRITFANGSEDWRVRLEPSKAFGDRPVVTVYTVKRAAFSDCLSVRIECSPAEWGEYSKAFLDLRPGSKVVKGGSYSGDLLLDDDRIGQLFVKGILVETRDGYSFGYNFPSASTDRDRRIINSFDLDYYTAATWEDALLSGNNLITPELVLDFLMASPADAACFRTRQPKPPAQALVAEAWQQRFGSDAIPVQDQAGVDAASHFGRHGVIAPAPVIEFFKGSSTMCLEAMRRANATKVTMTYRPGDLGATEIRNFSLAIDLIGLHVNAVPGLKPLTGRTSVVEFSNPKVLGMHCPIENAPGESAIYIARHCLSSLPRTLEILAHEAAHDAGADGSANHQRAEGALFSHMVASLVESEIFPVPVAA
jgi:hypothetical protein